MVRRCRSFHCGIRKISHATIAVSIVRKNEKHTEKRREMYEGEMHDTRSQVFRFREHLIVQVIPRKLYCYRDNRLPNIKLII